MRVVLLRPPRYVWPFNSERSAFWQPLGLLCLGAAVRKDLPEVDVEVIDASGERFGWKTLRRRVAEKPIDVLGIGEETVSAHEGLRGARMVKQLYPNCVVVAGGLHYAHTVEQTLRDGCVDVIVRGEGEATFVELLEHIDDRARWERIEGIAFLDSSGDVQITPARPLIEDLDSLPFPAYDLVPMEMYGRGSRNHPGLVAIEHSRGCVDNCAFCILWKHMGQRVGGNGQVKPCYRTQSSQRSFENVMRLYREFDRRTFGWVDPTFNVSPRWSDEFSERILGSELTDPRGRPRTLHTAWIRADCAVRDEKLGVLEKLVRAGLRQVMIGVERDDGAGLAALNKHNNGPEICREAFAIFREKYPRVYTIGTVIYGLPRDTLDDLKHLVTRQYVMGMDYCFVIPLTPNPGTGITEDTAPPQRVVSDDFRSYNFHTPVCSTDTLDLRQLESIYWRIMVGGGGSRLNSAMRNLLFERDRRKRRVYLSLLSRGTSIAARSLLRAIVNPKETKPALYSRKPSWYDK